jgi:hypothetical protein
MRQPFVCLLLLIAPALAQAPAPANDELMDHLVGAWKMEGQVMKQEAHHDVRADWVLNHQFLRIQEKTAAQAPSAEHPYDATWYLGYDATSERYVLHLFDIFGPRFSETLGYGTRDGNAIRFIFEYPDGPFHTTFRWIPEQNAWQWQMEQKSKEGKWAPFADLKLTRSR